MRHFLIHQAIGVLTLACRISPDEAFERLMDVAKRNEIEVDDLAAAVVTVASGCQPTGHREIIDREWGDLLL